VKLFNLLIKQGKEATQPMNCMFNSFNDQKESKSQRVKLNKVKDFVL
jgi:hypothetical protein